MQRMQRVNRWKVAIVLVGAVLWGFAPARVHGQDAPNTPDVHNELQQLRERVKTLETQQEEQQKAQEAEAAEEQARKKKAIARRALYEGLLPGFTYIPGTDTQFKLGGYVRMDIIHDFQRLDRGQPGWLLYESNPR